MNRRRRLALAGLLGVVVLRPAPTFAGAQQAVPGVPVGESAGAPMSGAAFLAGAASRLITPDVGGTAAPVALAGFSEGRIATGVRDDLFARAVVIEAGDKAVAIVSLDLYGLMRQDALRVRDEIRGRTPRIGVEGVLVACTRNHAAPDVTGEFLSPGAGVDGLYLGRVVLAAADAVEEAWRNRQPARLSFAATRLPRTLRDTRQPVRIDDQAILVRFESASGKMGLATLLSYAGRAETLRGANTLISADYPGTVRRALEESFGGLALFLTGPSGGALVPEADAGEKLARKLQVAWSGRQDAAPAGHADLTQGRLSLRQADLGLPVDNVGLLEALKAGRRRGSLAAVDRLTTEVSLLALFGAGGGAPVLEIACVPGEIYPELADGGIQEPQDPAADLKGEPPEASFRSLMSAGLRVVAGVCNDDLGDIIPASQWDEKPPFAYGLPAAQRGEATSPGPRTAPLLLKAFADLRR